MYVKRKKEKPVVVLFNSQQTQRVETTEGHSGDAAQGIIAQNPAK